MTITTQESTPESIWTLIREIALRQEETDRQIKETDRQMKETDRRMQEMDRKLQEKLQETLQGLKEARELFTTQWGRLIESLVDGRLVELFNRRGIGVYDTSTRVKGNRNGRSYEFDIIAHDGEKIVLVEVKTTLRPDDVKEFLGKLHDTRVLMPRYRENIIHGAMAWLQADAGAEKMAINRGLFSIRAVGDSASILNGPDFEPRAF
uniref:DUF3782 domain-containing protein n=1 Tax=Candidatus Kentrum sp. SD TaxID=2126332 RepID=A0A451BM17_9GAMM|nr:MAG: Uncharacterised protein family UPF0102 [Candidatus Kentron sp. SD]VFK44317.1 MAG: Uncharacterised protein family UPF0102 [Candidatus Kentron sp. SD]VFK79304.1 MAG: Uncharacterised protein family UPF0102 [Candidatus Kentron sp. SD]